METSSFASSLIQVLRKQVATAPSAVRIRPLCSLLTLIAAILPGTCLAGYVPPVGIPTPPFGIDETVSMYSNATYDFGKGPVPYPDAGNGPYTHYVDNTSKSATDTNNTYGTPDKPRLTVPATLAAGSVVEIHGTNYTAHLHISAGGAVGTAAKPIFIRGYSAVAGDRPVMKTDARDNVDLIQKDSYLIVENIIFDTIAHIQIDTPSDHIALRNLELKNIVESENGVDKNGTQAINIWSDSAHKNMTDFADNIVIYNCQIHNNAFPPQVSDGVHGITPSNGSRHVWILNCQIYDNGEDNIQIYYQTGRNQPVPQYIYIGGNKIYNEGSAEDRAAGKGMENAVDIKQSFDVVVSSNEMYGYYPVFGTVGSDGAAVVFNNDSPSSRLWLVNNYIHDSTIGARNQSVGEVYVVDNVFEHMYHEPGQTYTGLVSAGVGYFNYAVDAYTGYTRVDHVVNNTFYHCDQGIVISRGLQHYVQNNIVGDLNITDGTTNHMCKQSSRTNVWEVNNNLLFSSGTAPAISIGSSKHYSAASFDAAGLGSGDLAANPLFITPGSDYSLNSGSPAIDAGTVANVYDTFQSLYGLSIAEDRAGTSRPQGKTWDIGAYEFGEDAP